MIEYYKSAYGLTLLLRVTGSATYRSFAPALVSAVLVVWIRLHKTHAASGTNNEATEQLPSLQNPTVVSIFMSSLSFLLVFRLVCLRKTMLRTVLLDFDIRLRTLILFSVFAFQQTFYR
jgi:hypothetical protein